MSRRGPAPQLDGFDVDGREVAAYGKIVAILGYSRRMIIDRMIAATALIQGAVLLTANPRDFRNIPDLKIEDWS